MARKVWKRLRLEAIIAFLVILAIILVSYPTKPAKAVALADDIIIGGAIFSWLAGMGITLSSQLGNDTGTIETMISGLKSIADQFSTFKNQAQGWFWSQIGGLVNDITILANEIGKKFVAFGSDVANAITELGQWIINQYNLISDMLSPVSINTYTSVFLVDGSTVTLGTDTNATRFYMGTTYNFIKGNNITVTHQSGTKYYDININNGLYTNHVTGSVVSDSNFYTLGSADSAGTVTISLYSYRSDGITRNGTFTISRSTDNGSTLYNGFAEEFYDLYYAGIDALGKDLLPDLDDVDQDQSGYVSIPGTVTGALPADPTKSDVMGGMLEEGAAGTITNTGTDAAAITISDSVPTTPEQPPSAGDLQTPGLADVFPFCIPFDIYQFFSCLLANREAPRIQATIDLKIVEWEIDIDLSSWNTAATICRTMELLAFCVLLAAKTRDLIRG